jgi:hypothetical protein
VLTAAPASAKLTTAQKFFAGELLKSPQVAKSVKLTLKKGGFVDESVLFADLTGEGKDDAVVLVDSGGSAGRIALYIFSSLDHAGNKLEIVYRNQRLYRGMARINPGPSLVYTLPGYNPGDELCCPSAFLERTLKWSTKRKKFGVVQRRAVPPS